MKSQVFEKSWTKKKKYIKFACDIETSTEYLLDSKPSASKDKKEYEKWDEKRINCKAWVYLYCAIKAGDFPNYLLDIDFESWLKKIINRCKSQHKSNKIRLWFHNLKYDGSFLLFELHKLGYRFCKSKELSQNEKTYTALIDGHKSIYNIKFWYNNYFFNVQCSYIIVRCGISEVLYAKNQKEIVIDYLPNTKYNSLKEVPKNVIEYIKQDCFAITIIWKIIREIKKNSFHVKNKLTIGAWGKEAAYLAFHRSKWYLKHKKELEKYHWNYEKDEKIFKELRNDYHGGLTGINKNFINENNEIDVEGNIKTYDINSAYPFIMNGEIPYMKPTTRKNDKEFLVYIEIKSIKSVKVLNTFWLLHDFFHNGKKQFWIWNFEWELIKQLIIINYRVLKKLYFCYIPFYQPFIEKINKLKEIYSKEINDSKNKEKQVFYGLLRRTVKLLMNSPYGKEAQKEYENVFITKDYQWMVVKDDRKTNFTNIAGAGFITAKTRSMILELLIKFPNNIIYWDTDCVHIIFDKRLTQEQFEKEVDVSKTKLGSWKLEIEADKARYLKKKCYALMKKDGTIKFKTAGYNFTEKTFKWNDFFRGNEIADISLFSFRNKWNQIILTKITKKL